MSQGAYDAMRDKLRRVAKYQRWVLLALLCNIILIVVSMCISMGVIAPPGTVLIVFQLVAVAVAIFMTVAAFSLARQFYNIVAAIVCAVLMWIPCISLIVLLIINQKATGFLQQHGIKVGLMGANLAKI